MNLISIMTGMLAVSKNKEDVLYTSSLGSCVAVCLHDKVNHVSGLAHVQLPDSSINPTMNQQKPGCFADHAIPLLIDNMYDEGAQREYLQCYLAGGASINGQRMHDYFHIGEQNIIACREHLKNQALTQYREDLGGHRPRTVRLSVATGELKISSLGNDYVL